MFHLVAKRNNAHLHLVTERNIFLSVGLGVALVLGFLWLSRNDYQALMRFLDIFTSLIGA